MEAEEYFRLAEAEDRMWYARALRAHIDSALARIRWPAAVTLLDAGCGTGGLLRHLAQTRPTWRCTGVDAEEIACELAGKRAPQAAIVRGTLEALPFAAASFDVVVAADVLYHLDDDLAAMRELRRVLKPGGHLLVNVPAHAWLWSYHDVAVHGRRRYSRRSLREVLAEGGFPEARVGHWNFWPLPLLILRRKVFPPREGHGSDVRVWPGGVERVFGAMAKVERAWLATGAGLPAGSSLFASARRD